ncbi:hypothetical protein NKR23_g3692 [Pleurostoma richardsiae]|uniref:Uncharacterized protein n=1 Tax=Pleurostoma richardsiae TaxID=41990 RepID=A0AA38VLF8_9PEZI|nr:hypothetical protein NKR23_g3692 [Pleurostoma richardsiae]
MQPLAIIACEQFGNTIAMSRESCLKVEKVVLPTPPPATIQFLRAAVGFSANDCATQLGSSLAGVQFLGLTAALATTISPYAAGEALGLMIFRRRLAPPSAKPKPKPSALKYNLTVPTPAAIQKVVDAFRQLSRVGNETVTSVTIKSADSTSWLAAFTKWCLGLPPSLYLPDGRPLLEEPNSPVNIIYRGDDGSENAFQLITHHTTGSLKEMVVLKQDESLFGMVSISSYGEWLLRDLGYDSDDAFRMLEQVIPYPLSETLTNISFMERPTDRDKNPLKNVKNQLLPRLSPFHGHKTILHVLSIMLNIDSVDSLPFAEKRPVSDLPAARKFLACLEENCICDSDVRRLFVHHNVADCKLATFIGNLSLIIREILTISLLCTPEAPKVQFPLKGDPGPRLRDAITKVLEDGVGIKCSIFPLIDHALYLVGHNTKSEISPQKWIMSSFRGQVVYPAIFDTDRVEKKGHLAMTWLPGVLRYKGDTYSQVVGSSACPEDYTPCDFPNLPKDDCPLNVMPGCKKIWQVAISDDVLQASMALASLGNKHHVVAADPTKLWVALSQLGMLEHCGHDPAAPVDGHFREMCRYSTVVNPTVPGKIDGRPIVGVVAVDGADDLRVLALCCLASYPIIMRKRVCLSCCPELRMKAGARVPIL